jgi:hypothetical protein
VLLDHRRVRELARSARDLPSSRPLTGALRLPTGGWSSTDVPEESDRTTASA